MPLAKPRTENFELCKDTERLENVTDITESTATTASFNTRVPMLVVTSSFVLVAQNFVSFRGLLELVNSLCITLIGIGVILQSELAIGFRNFVQRRGLLYAENFVVTSFRGHVQARDEKVGASDAPKLVSIRKKGALAEC